MPHPVCPQLLPSHLVEMPDSFALKDRETERQRMRWWKQCPCSKVVLGRVVIGFNSKTKGDEKTTAQDVQHRDTASIQGRVILWSPSLPILCFSSQKPLLFPVFSHGVYAWCLLVCHVCHAHNQHHALMGFSFPHTIIEQGSWQRTEHNTALQPPGSQIPRLDQSQRFGRRILMQEKLLSAICHYWQIESFVFLIVITSVIIWQIFQTR